MNGIRADKIVLPFIVLIALFLPYGLSADSGNDPREAECASKKAINSLFERENSGWSIGKDNDSFLDTDQNYSFGLYGSVSGSAVQCWPLSTHGLQKWINQLWRVDEKLTLHATEFGLSAFTPDNLSASRPIPDDRPYASLVYLNTLQTSLKRESTAIRSELSIGILGTGLGEFFQSEWHRLLRQVKDSDTPVDPKGWSHQISDGGEPTFRYSVSRIRRLSRSNLEDSFDFTWSLDGSVGYYTEAGTSIGFRWGRLNTKFYEIDLVPTRGVDAAYMHLNSLAAGSAAPQRDGKNGIEIDQSEREIYFFASARATAIGYNVMLQGQFRSNPVEFDADEIERFILEGRVGFVYQFSAKGRFMGYLAHRSREFEGPDARSHRWMGFFLSWSIGPEDA